MESMPRGARTPPQRAERAGFEDLPSAVRERLPGRDAEALAIFYEAYFDPLYGYVRRMVGEEHLAEDLTQEVFMHLHQNLPSYDPTRALRPWVFTIATNKVRDYWRSRRHQNTLREVELGDEESGRLVASTLHGPDEHMQSVEASDEVARAIESLPDSMRATLVLRYYEGLSFEAIGEIIDRNEAAVRKRYSRALEELRKSLPGMGGGA